jgi:hypothetical protein
MLMPFEVVVVPMFGEEIKRELADRIGKLQSQILKRLFEELDLV